MPLFFPLCVTTSTAESTRRNVGNTACLIANLRENHLADYRERQQALSGAKVTFRVTGAETLPVYLNNSPMVCTAVEGNFDQITKDYNWRCPQCDKSFKPESAYTEEDGTEHYMACSQRCLDDLAGNDESYRCESCNRRVHEDNIYRYDDNYYCEACYDERFTSCERCGETTNRDDLVEVHFWSRGRGHHQNVCPNCLENHYTPCAHCDDQWDGDDMSTPSDNEDNWYCPSCFASECHVCEECGEAFEEDLSENNLCEDCQSDADALNAEEEAVNG